MNLKQFSEKLGISPTTVSRALNDYPEVSEATRQRVKDAAKQYAYAPSANARRLATGQTRAIAHVIPLAEHHMINPHFSDFLAGAGATYSVRGYDLLMTVVPGADELDVYRRLVNGRRVDGFLVQGPKIDDPRIKLLKQLDIPFSVHGRTGDVDPDTDSASAFSWLDVNNRRAFRRGVDYLLDLGHERIALLNGFEHLNFAHLRRKGYEQALTARGITPDPRLMYSEEMLEPYGFRATNELLALPPDQRPTAIVAASILTSMGVQRAAQHAGLTLGRELSLLSFDDCLSFLGDSRGTTVPDVTTLRSSIYDAGVRLAEMLIDTVEQPGSSPHHELWEAELVLGRSTGPAPKTGS